GRLGHGEGILFAIAEAYRRRPHRTATAMEPRRCRVPERSRAPPGRIPEGLCRRVRSAAMLLALLAATALALPQELLPQVSLPQASVPQGPGARGASDASTAVEPTFAPEQLRACAAAAERGLLWLEREQKAGCWTGIVGHKMQNDYLELDSGTPVAVQRAQGQGHVGVTALCGMAFLAGGHLPDRGAHGASVKCTIDYLLEHVRDNGLCTDAGTRMYSHAFATLFLAEVYGMAGYGTAGGRPVKDALEKAVNLIVDSQNQYGGWRYNPFDREIDLSVTVCQVQALRAARNIGIKVPDGTINRAIAYVERSQVQSGRSRGQLYYKMYARGCTS